VSGLTFTVHPGDYTCIVGENGSGKSTLIRALLGLKSVATGKIEYGHGLKREHIGYLPQCRPEQKDFPASVYEVVISGCGARGPFYSKAARAKAKENMGIIDIAHLKSKRFSTLSGGQRQRVLLARALCAADRLVLLDEPAAGLDPVITHTLYRNIEDVNRAGMAVVMVTHDVHCALRHATHVLHIMQPPRFFTAEDYRQSDIGQCYLCGVNDEQAQI